METPTKPMTRVGYQRFVCRNFELMLDALWEEQNISNTAVAEQLGMTWKRVSNWKRGQNFPDVHSMYILGQTLGRTMPWIYERDPSGLVNWLRAALVRKLQLRPRPISQA